MPRSACPPVARLSSRLPDATCSDRGSTTTWAWAEVRRTEDRETELDRDQVDRLVAAPRRGTPRRTCPRVSARRYLGAEWRAG